MIRPIAFLLLYSFSQISNVNGQRVNQYWCFGDSAGIDFTNLSMPVPITSYMDCPYSCTSVGDTNGLLMYAHTSYWPLYVLASSRTTVVHNKFHNIMQNGDSLIGRAFYNGLTFLNKPGSDSLYYLFQWGYNSDAGLYYSLIDPYYNDSGTVIFKNIKLQLSDSSLEYGVNAVRHGNGRDWWIITRNGLNSNQFNLFYVGLDSIFGPLEQNVGTITSTNSTQISISKNGDRLCLVSYTGLVEVYNFDRCSGIISNPLQINLNLPATAKLFAGEFSSNGELLYVVNTDNIFGDSLRLCQINLSRPNPSDSIIVLYQEKIPASGGNLRRGPDDKIYLSCLHETGWPYEDTCRYLYNENLSVINDPDSIGISCNFQPFSFYLGGKRTYWSLPNNPNYALGPIINSSCDSLFNGTYQPVFLNENIVYPNPAVDFVIVGSNYLNAGKLSVQNSLGEIIFTKQVNRLEKIDLTFMKSGLYLFKFQSEEKIYFQKVIKIN
jgi:hypothetical protein